MKIFFMVSYNIITSLYFLSNFVSLSSSSIRLTRKPIGETYSRVVDPVKRSVLGTRQAPDPQSSAIVFDQRREKIGVVDVGQNR